MIPPSPLGQAEALVNMHISSGRIRHVKLNIPTLAPASALSFARWRTTRPISSRIGVARRFPDTGQNERGHLPQGKATRNDLSATAVKSSDNI
jgi:hypothetical protein